MGVKQLLKAPWVHQLNREYKKDIASSTMSFQEYCALMNASEEPRHLSAELERKMQEIQDDLVFLTSGDCVIYESAKQEFAYAFLKHPECMIGYCDILEAGKPIYRPDWSPNLFLSRFYFRGIVAIRKSVVSLNCGEELVPEGDEALTEAILWNICYRILSRVGAFNKRKKNKESVIHVSKVLGECKALGEYKGADTLSREEEEFDRMPTVSIVIPSKDQPFLLQKCVKSIRETTKEIKEDYLEIIVVDNGSSPENQKMVEKLSKELSFTYLYEPMPFSFSKMCNLGADHASKDFLLFLNDDIECRDLGWMSSMMEVAVRPYVGATGMKLLYPDGNRIQHAGIVNLPMGPVHKLQFLEDETTQYDSFNRGIRDCIAVTGACLMVRRSLFVEFGGFREQLAVAFNDVELCFRFYEAGYYNVCMLNHALTHHESVSRGADESKEKWERLMAEKKVLDDLHPLLCGKDPFYNLNLNHLGLDCNIRPAYEVGKRTIDEAFSSDIASLDLETLEKAREDACLHVRLETVKSLPEAKVEGYGVVLGSNNACFYKKLLFRSCKHPELIYTYEYTPQYRIDLIENMPDQVNVGMSGFSVVLPSSGTKNVLPAGEYEVGMLALDRTSKQRIISFTGRTIKIGGDTRKRR